MKKTGQVFFLDENEDLFLAESFEDENANVTTTQTKLERDNFAVVNLTADFL